jgi:hypothetical protein
MGGFGSGGWNSTGRATAGDAMHLDVNRLNKTGCLEPGARSRPSWTRGDEPAGNITVQANHSGLTLIYRTSTNGGEWQDVREPVTIIWEPCNFGGRRPYFLCPECGRRSVKLYGLARFLCRSCNRLAYQCQRESGSDRALRKDWKLRAKLGGEPGMSNPIPDRPKGMHWRTYNAIVDEIYRVETVVDDFTFALVARLLNRASSNGEFWS